jgi:hypothetical protein
VSLALERSGKTGIEDYRSLLTQVGEQGIHAVHDPLGVGVAYETLLIARPQALDGNFPPEGRSVFSNRLAIDQLNRKPAPRVPGAFTGIVLSDTRADIFRDAGIQTLVRTPDYVDVPLRHLSKILQAKIL